MPLRPGHLAGDACLLRSCWTVDAIAAVSPRCTAGDFPSAPAAACLLSLHNHCSWWQQHCAAVANLLSSQAPLLAWAATQPQAVGSIVDLVKATGEAVKTGVSAAQTGAEYARAAYEQVRHCWSIVARGLLWAGVAAALVMLVLRCEKRAGALGGGVACESPDWLGAQQQEQERYSKVLALRPSDAAANGQSSTVE